MDKIAQIGDFPNPMKDHMSNTWRYISTLQMDQLFDAIFRDYCNVFQITIKVMLYDANIFTDIDLVHVSNLVSFSPNNQTSQERCVFLVYCVAQQLFLPVAFSQKDRSVKLFLEHHEGEIIEGNVLSCIRERNQNGKIEKFSLHVYSVSHLSYRISKFKIYCRQKCR